MKKFLILLITFLLAISCCKKTSKVYKEIIEETYIGEIIQYTTLDSILQIVDGTELQNDTLLSGIDAVKNKKVVKIDTSIYKPNLTLPLNKVEIDKKDVTFSWDPVSSLNGENVMYRVKIVSENGLVYPKQYISDTSFTVAVDSGVVYNWNVYAKIQKGIEIKSETWSFVSMFDTLPLFLTADIQLVYPQLDAEDILSKDGFYTLVWEHAQDTTSEEIVYDIYLSESSFDLELVGHDVPVTALDIEKLKSGTKYYWKVIAKNLVKGTTVESYLGSFNTVEGIVPYIIPIEIVSDIDMEVKTTSTILSWQNPFDTGFVNYSVYLGVVADETNVISKNQIDTICEIDSLNPATTYYWYVESKFDSLEARSPLAKFTTTDTLYQVIDMVYVEGGTFEMGHNEGDPDERPARDVTISSFKIGRYEITQGQWELIMGTRPSYFNGRDRPVEQVSWELIQIYISKLNEKTGKEYRLPTEAEWEFAAKGGVRSRGYNFAGSDTLMNVAWFFKFFGNKTHSVGLKGANELGIFDMTGNVLEWCNDYYDNKYYSSAPDLDPKGPAEGRSRVNRGGSWFTPGHLCFVTYRDYYDPKSSVSGVGFRLAQDIEN